jgi:hypothetical protein
MRGKSAVALALCGAGMLAATGCGTTVATARPTATAGLTAAATLTAAVSRTTAQTARIAITTTMQMQGMTVSFTESGAFDFARSRGTLTMDGPAGFTELFVPPQMYIKVPAGAGESLPKGKTWVAADTGTSGDLAASGLGGLLPGPVAGNGDPADLLASLTAISGSVTKQGTTTIRGVPVTEYRVTIDLAKAAARVPGWEQASYKEFTQSTGAKTIPVEVWVDSQNLVRRMREALPMPAGLGAPAGMAVSQTTDFYDFGVPVQVSAPPASEVASLSQLIINGSPTGSPVIAGGDLTPAAPPQVSGTLSPAQAAAAEQAVRAFWAALGGNDPAAVAQTVPPAQRSCVRSMLGDGPKITVTSLRIVSAQPAGNGTATVRFTVQAHLTIGGTTLPVLPQGSGTQQWLVATEEAGHWYVDLASSSDVMFSGACP